MSTSATTKKKKTKKIVPRLPGVDEQIRFDVKRKAFVYRNHVVSGLLPRLQRLLYPDYDWDLAVAMQKKKQTENRKGEKDTKKRKAECHGLSSGKKLDRQLSQAIYFARTRQLDCSVFIHAGKRQAASAKLTQRDAARLCQLSAHLCLPAQNFFRMCSARRITPMFSQTTVGCKVTRVATMVDVKCTDADGGVVLIENKVGYSQFARASTGNMRYPYLAQTNCAFNQHQTQLALTTLLHDTTFPSQKATASFVWRYDENGVSQYPLEDWARQGAEQVLSLMRAEKIQQ
jgi:hypothetical protein